MQSGNTIGWAALIIVLLAAGYAFQQEKSVQSTAPVDSVDLNSSVAPSHVELPETKEVSRQEGSLRNDVKTKTVKRLSIVKEALDESGLPTGLPPEDMVLDPDAEQSGYEADVVPINIGEYIDPDSEDSLASHSGVEEEVQHIGEYIDPDADASLMAPGPEVAPQHIGPFIDVDSEGGSHAVQGGPEEVINIGEYIPVPDEAF